MHEREGITYGLNRFTDSTERDNVQNSHAKKEEVCCVKLEIWVEKEFQTNEKENIVKVPGINNSEL